MSYVTRRIEPGTVCRLALHAGLEPDAARAALAEYDDRLGSTTRRSARFLLWRATGDQALLLEAKKQLDEALARVPADVRERLRTNVPLNRNILAALAPRGR